MSSETVMNLALVFSGFITGWAFRGLFQEAILRAILMLLTSSKGKDIVLERIADGIVKIRERKKDEQR